MKILSRILQIFRRSSPPSRPTQYRHGLIMYDVLAGEERRARIAKRKQQLARRDVREEEECAR